MISCDRCRQYVPADYGVWRYCESCQINDAFICNDCLEDEEEDDL